MASLEENDSNLRSSRPRKLDSPFTEEDLLMRETEAEWEANLVFLEAESPFIHAFEQGQSTLIEPEELEGEFTEEEWTADNFSMDEAETLVEEGLVDWEDGVADLEDELLFYTEQEDNLFENRELLEEASPAEMRETAPDFVPLPVEQPGGGRIRDKRDPPSGDLEEIKGVGGKNIQLHRLAAAAWRALVAAARRDGIREPLLLIVSGYRSTDKQAKLYRDAVKRYGSESEARKWVAPPGGSPHHSGRAIDFYLGGKNSSGNVKSLRQKPAYLWLAKYARQFGFYPYEREPWHWEYNPPASIGSLEGTASAGKPSLPGSVVPVQLKQQSSAKPTAELVLFAQRVLNAAEGGRLKDDGNLGPLTSAALERFRKKYSLGTGGTLDASTVLALVQRALEELAQASMFARMGTRDARTEQAITTFKAAHQLGMDSRIDSAMLRALTDALLRMAPKPTSATMPQKSAFTSPSTYLGGKLWTFEAKTLPTRVAVFCPPAALSKREVEVLVYSHGLLNGCRRPKSIPDGIITDAPFKLGNIVAASNIPIILVVPYLDWASPGGERAFGKGFRKWHALGKPAHLNSIVAEVLAEAGQVQGITTPSLRNLVIAGHSRAYDFLEPLAYSRSDPQMKQGALSRLSQVWAFDSTYTGNVSNWMSWLDANPRLRVSIFYEPGSRTGKVGDEFFRRKGGSLAVIHAKEGHCAVPAKRLPELLKSLSFAADQEVHLDEDELEPYSERLEDEGYASEIYSDETFYDENVIDTEFEAESEDKYEEVFELAKEQGFDSFDSWEELDLYEQYMPSEPELNSFAFDALGSDSEYTFNGGEEEFEFEDEDYADQLLEEEASDKSPLPVPAGNPVQFAPLPPPGSYWPVRTSRKDARIVSYMYQAPSGIVGRAGRMFLAGRKGNRNGKQALRWHVGIDLFANVKDVVVACEDGTIVDFSFFYRAKSGQRTYKLLVQHEGSGVVVNYGELTGDSLSRHDLRVGGRVSAGQTIGFVSDTSMLHFETYIKGTKTSHRWWKDEKTPPLQLLNPTRYLLFLCDNGLPLIQGTRTQPIFTLPAVVSKKPPSELVRFVQRVLNAAEGERLDLDGDLGPLTVGALTRFRQKYNLGAGGMLDSKTELALAQRALEEIAKQSIFAQPGVLDSKTEQALISFKLKHGLLWNATLDVPTRAALMEALGQLPGAPSVPSTLTGSLDIITRVAAESQVTRYKWRDRGVAPPGYIKGMALTYARVYCKLKAGDAAAKEMAIANTGNTDKDALAHYAQEFNAAGMSNEVSGADTLRHLFVLLIGLGMRESGGRYCVGRDRSASNTSAETAEAGLFQTSYNARKANSLMPQLFKQYLANPSGFIEVFREGVKCKANDLENFGEGDGRVFQRLSKDCPAFAAEFTAVGLRNVRKHWGPINRKAAEIRPECDAMLMQVQKVVDEFKLCQFLR